MPKQDLPNSLTGGLNYIGEKQKYNTLYEANSRTQSGQMSWTSSTSNVVYNTADYSGDATIYNKGEDGLLQILKNVLLDYLLTASDINNKLDTSALDTDIALTANSDTKIATQKAVKTYVDGKGGKTDLYYTTTSSTGNIGAFVCDGVDDYATLPASVGQLTDGTSTFELVVKFKTDDITKNQAIINKRDTAYSATNAPKGWKMEITTAGKVDLCGYATNGATEQKISGVTVLANNSIAFSKVTFDGTTISLYLSNDGINFNLEGTSTNANLISGLSTSDNVLTYIAKLWQGSTGFVNLYDGTICSIQLTKAGTLTNRYEFKNFGTNQAVNDTAGTSHGTSAGGAVQGGSAYATLDGSDDYGVLPANVGRLTNGTSTFDLIVKFNTTDAEGTLIGKRDTGYSAGTDPKGWDLRFDTSTSRKLRIIGTASNGTTQTEIYGTTVLNNSTIYYARVNFNGTTVTLYTSTDGTNWTSEGTSTSSNLIGGLAISDSVNTQIGRVWLGSQNYLAAYYFAGNIYSVSITKNGALRNFYSFLNTGTNTNILDDVSSENGTSSGGLVQTLVGNYGHNFTATTGKYSALTDNMRFMMEANATASTAIQPTLNLDGLGAKQIIGTDIVAGRVYDVRYKSAIDSYVAITQEEKLVGGKPFVLSQAATSFTISGLDINRDGGMYDIEISNTDTGLSMYINGDTTATNYYNGTTPNANNTTNTGVISPSSHDRSSLNVQLYMCNKGDGALKAMASILGVGYNTNGVYGIQYWWEHKSTQTNITSITISRASNMPVGTTVKIYKR